MSPSLSAMRWAWARPQIKGHAKLVLLCLCDHADAEGLAYPSPEKVAAECGLGVNTVRRVLAQLRQAGVITESGRHGHATRWRLNTDWDGDVVDPSEGLRARPQSTRKPTHSGQVEEPTHGGDVPAEPTHSGQVPDAQPTHSGNHNLPTVGSRADKVEQDHGTVGVEPAAVADATPRHTRRRKAEASPEDIAAGQAAVKLAQDVVTTLERRGLDLAPPAWPKFVAFMKAIIKSKGEEQARKVFSGVRDVAWGKYPFTSLDGVFSRPAYEALANRRRTSGSVLNGRAPMPTAAEMAQRQREMTARGATTDG